MSGSAYVFRQTGDATYKARADAAFARGVAGAWYDGSKQPNELYHNSFRYIAWRGA